MSLTRMILIAILSLVLGIPINMLMNAISEKFDFFVVKDKNNATVASVMTTCILYEIFIVMVK